MQIFRDLFVLQIVGILQDRKYSGRLRLACDKAPASIGLHEGNVTRITYAGHDEREALRLLLWRSLGELELDPTLPPPGSALDYAALAEDLIQTTMPSMPASCPMLETAHVERTSLKPAQQSVFRDSGFNILLNIKKGTMLADIHQTMPDTEFWPAFLHLTSNGQALCSYGPTLGKLLTRFEQDLLGKLEKLLGPQVTKTYHELLGKHLRNLWPEWQPDTEFDSIYGAAPYYDWAKALKHCLGQLGTPTMTGHCYDKALEKLSAADALIFKQLISP